MMDVRELYHELIIDHGRNPRNCCTLNCATHHADGYNPLCGDKVHLNLSIKDGVIEKACFQGSGCAISMASASLMTEEIKGKSINEVGAMFEQFQAMVTGETQDSDLSKLSVLAGVSAYPSRVKCATLAWHTLQSALANEENPVSTE